jgi:hypothetical protein
MLQNADVIQPTEEGESGRERVGKKSSVTIFFSAD